MVTRRAILIAGPTASGKSALALELALRVGGVVINADSMQVYRDLRVLTARPDADDTARVPHRLYGEVDGADAYSVGRFLQDARRVIAQTWEAGRVPIFVGGTGLYFKALLEGLSPIPPIPGEIRSFWRAQGLERGAAALHAELARRDPASARGLQPTDTQRLVRALEVIEATGQGLASWQQVPGVPVLDAKRTLRLLVRRPRADLLARADLRFEVMVDRGAVEEVRSLMARGLPEGLPVRRALGVEPIALMIQGRLSREEAIRAGQADTRAYIKRQVTWAQKHMMSWIAVDLQ